MEAHETAPLFKADSATLSFYATKDGRITVTYQGLGSKQGCARRVTVRIRAGLLTVKMTPPFIRAHGTALRVANCRGFFLPAFASSAPPPSWPPTRGRPRPRGASETFVNGGT